MAHFAEIDENNVVLQVIVAEQDFIDTLDGTWIQTSYNTQGGKHYNEDGNEEGNGLRKNYAGIGFTYDADRDAFIPPKPFDSWLLNEDSCRWGSPIPMPELSDADKQAGKLYIWDESVYQADNTQGWVLTDPEG